MGLRSFRRSGVVACLAVGAVVATGVGAPAGAEEDFVAGSGEVEARLVRMGPSAGRLSFATSVGHAYADYRNAVARAQSRYFDFAALDDSIPPEMKDHAPVVRVTSTDDDAAEGEVVTTAGFPDDQPVRAGGTRQEARADDTPMGEAVFVLGDFAPVPGAVELAQGRVVTRAGIVDGVTRQATGTVSFGRISLGDGAAVLQGATWTVRQRTGVGEESTGSFRVEGLTAGDQELRPPDGGPTPEQWAQLNEVLAPLGLRVHPPEVTVADGLVSVGPLGIRVMANEAGRTAGPPVIEGLQPVREPLADALIEEEPEAGSLLTLGDLALGAVAGSGVVDLELGGSTAFTEGESFDDPFGSFDLGGGATTPSLAAGTAGVGGPDPAPGLTDGPAPVVAPDDETSGGTAAPLELADSRRRAGTTGGPAAVVGVLGLIAVLAMAGADWWRMRHAPRMIALP